MEEIKQSPLELWYDEIPPRVSLEGNGLYGERYNASAYRGEKPISPEAVWENYALPLGCGQMGACVFGYPDVERVQITENSLSNPFLRYDDEERSLRYGLQGFAELFIDFGHANEETEDYRRALSLDDATARVSYRYRGVRYERTYFASHPAGVLVMRFDASEHGKLDFVLRPEIPYLGEWCIQPEDGCSRTGKIEASGNTLTLSGVLGYYGIQYEGVWRVLPEGGSVRAEGETLIVSGADSAVLFFAAATNYRLESHVFLESDPKKKLSPYPHPHDAVMARMEKACRAGYDALLAEHLSDYRALFSRVRLSLGESVPAVPTDRMIEDYKNGKECRYAELLLYAYGRYLLIACSRRGGLPANLQGVWAAGRSTPWSGGYWHNVNVQMNYWHACATGLSELFLAYSDYARAYMPLARAIADGYVRANYPDRDGGAGNNGWLVRTGAWQYTLDTNTTIGHSGPGTGAFTSLLFWDYYDYTRDEAYLREVAYPILREMSLFFTKVLIEKDGFYLVGQSASPENGQNGVPYHTVGCAFDQQMVYENFKRTLEAAAILGEKNDALLEEIRAKLPRLSPVLIGADGQVKEYREEERYGEIGEYQHRHISHLVGLYPLTVIGHHTPDWLEAAKVTLTRRGDRSTGWAAAHRLCLWARAGRGDKVMDLVRSMMRHNVLRNMWDSHPPFQIDGNFGYTAGVSEALLGSADGVIRFLPALPEEWQTGGFDGLAARGNFVVSCRFEEGSVTAFSILSRVGGEMKVSLDGVAVISFFHNGREIFPKDGLLTVRMAAGDTVEGK